VAVNIYQVPSALWDSISIFVWFTSRHCCHSLDKLCPLISLCPLLLVNRSCIRLADKKIVTLTLNRYCRERRTMDLMSCIIIWNMVWTQQKISRNFWGKGM